MRWAGTLLAGFVGWACCLALAASASAAGQGGGAPNVLVICADDHAAYVSVAYGNRRVRTPNIDRLAAGGVCFDRAYCNSPVCTASRQSLLTGRYPRSIGVTRLQTALPDAEVTMAETLREAGFATAAIGKMHFNSELTHGFDVRTDLREYDAWLARQARQPVDPAIPVQPPWRPFKDPARVWLNSACLPMGLGEAIMDGTYLAEQAAAYLTAAHDRPFLLMVSFYEPHSPFRFPIEYAGRHEPAEFDVPALGPQDDDQIPAVFRDLTPREKQGIMAAYYTSVEFLDRNVGRVLDALDRSGQAGNTVVVYLSDHGYMLGQHGRFEKHTSYEEAVRTPLVIRRPGETRAGQRTEALVELVDLAPTVYELCGVPRTAGLQGRSLVPLLEGKATTHREHVVVEYAPNDEAMIRDEHWKLVYERGTQRRTDGYDTGRPLTAQRFRLYDLRVDPQEMTNVADRLAHAETVRRLTDRLIKHLTATAREKELIPRDADRVTLLDFLVQPRTTWCWKRDQN